MRTAFTAIELLIAVALGAVLVATASAAFSVAAHSTAVANRLSTENGLMRAGYLEAHRELDFWIASDDPDSTAPQPLRGAGLPFSPFPARSGAGEAERGWDPDYRWPVADPRTWYHGNIGEHTEQRAYEQTFGRYAMFGCTETDPVFSATPEGKGFAVAEPVRHTWLYNQMTMLIDGLGFYGYCDYLPANAIYAPYLPYVNGATTNGGIRGQLIVPGWGFVNGDGGVSYARGLFLLTFGSSYVLPGVTGRGAGAIAGAARGMYNTSYFADSSADGTAASTSYQALLDASEDRRDLLALAPSHWPRTQVSVQRLVKDARRVAVARVRWTSPLTGAVGEIAFAGFGTTLRGARQQRRPGGGWARWDDVGSSNDPTLDGP